MCSRLLVVCLRLSLSHCVLINFHTTPNNWWIHRFDDLQEFAIYSFLLQILYHSRLRYIIKSFFIVNKANIKPFFMLFGVLMNWGVAARWINHPLTLGKKVVKIGQKIEGGRDRHKHFWSSWGYNFLSFKGMTLKLIQATILDSRKILE